MEQVRFGTVVSRAFWLAVLAALVCIVALQTKSHGDRNFGYESHLLSSDFPPPPAGGFGMRNRIPPVDYGVADRILQRSISSTNDSSTPKNAPPRTPAEKRVEDVTKTVITQRQNLSAALRLFERLLPTLGYDDNVHKNTYKITKEKNLEMLKASQARFGKLKQEKSNMEKELRKLKTIERMRIREGAKPSPVLVDAKRMIAEYVEKLDAAIDICEGEFKPFWLETVRENQIIKAEQRAKDAFQNAWKMLHQQFVSGHIFLPGIFVQLIPELDDLKARVANPKIQKAFLSTLPLVAAVGAGSVLVRKGLHRIFQSKLPSLATKNRLLRFVEPGLKRLGSSRLVGGALSIMKNLDLFLAVRVTHTVVLGIFNVVTSKVGVSEQVKDTVKACAGILKNLDIVLIATAFYKAFSQMKPLPVKKISDKIVSELPSMGQAFKAVKAAGKLAADNSRMLVVTYCIYRVATSLARAFDGVKSIKIGIPGFRRSEEEDEHQGIKYDLLDVPDVSFDDVAGLQNLRNEVTEIVDFLKESRKYGRVRAKCPKGVLMTGPPGVGKTLLAKAIAGEAGICFLPCAGSDFNSNIAGSGAEKMRSIWAKAEKNAPCILFIDEIDYVGSKRTEGSKGGAEQDRTGLMTVLLTKMDGINSRDDIFVIGTSNRLDILDPALLRPGRFDRHVELTLPDTKGRKEVLSVHSRDRPFAPNINLENIARKTSGFSGAELANIINEAAIHAGRRSSPVIDQEDLESAYHKVILGVASERKQTLDYRKSVAVHEAGHAVLAMIMKKRYGDDYKTVTQVSILPRSKGSAGVTCFMNPQEDVKRTKALLQADLAVGLGGRAAEEIWYGKDGIQLGASSDIQATTSLARRMILEEGMSKAVGLVNVNVYSPEEARKNAHNEVKSMIDRAYEHAKEILRINEVLHRQMVYTLLREETIGEEQLTRLAKLYPPAEE